MTIFVEGVILQLTEQTGALIVYAGKGMRGKQVNAIGMSGPLSKRPHISANVVERTIDGRSVFAAVFPRVPAGDYYVEEEFGWHLVRMNHKSDVTVFPSEVAEVDWR